LLLHGIKGSAAYLEQAELVQLCDQLERAADQGDWASLDAALPRLRALLGACAAEAEV
jgi:HPt (histidine-containing phosphotransfer) domain-containing protein